MPTICSSLVDVHEVFSRTRYSKGLRKRLCQTAVALSHAPAQSFPHALGPAGYTGLLRMGRNPRIAEELPFSAVVEETSRRIAEHECVLALHDTTDVRYAGAKRRRGLGRLNTHDQGFLLHLCLAVTADGSRRPLGVLGMHTWVRAEERASEQSAQQRYDDPNKESLRWKRLVLATEQQAGPPRRLIHVMDREADDYALLCALQQRGSSFVIRMRQDRCLAQTPADLQTTLRGVHQALAQVPLQAGGEREVELSPRPLSPTPQANKRHPPRSARTARLGFRALSVSLARPKNVDPALAAAVAVNVVHVVETDPPEDEPAVEWFLLTSEPIATCEQVLRMVDIYRARWTIEEFFKALKTGCSLEARQLESFEALQLVLILFLPIATNMLLVRTLAQQEPTNAAADSLAPALLSVLRATARRPLAPCPTNHQLFLAIADLGGYLPHKRPPGWLVLARGMKTLYERAIGWHLAEAHLSIKKSDRS